MIIIIYFVKREFVVIRQRLTYLP